MTPKFAVGDNVLAITGTNYALPGYVRSIRLVEEAHRVNGEWVSEYLYTLGTDCTPDGHYIAWEKELYPAEMVRDFIMEKPFVRETV